MNKLFFIPKVELIYLKCPNVKFYVTKTILSYLLNLELLN
jgi:hypothetical protein